MSAPATHTDFGIHAAALMALELFDLASRRSGRTTAVLAQAEPGDLFLTCDERHARRLESELRARGVNGVVVSQCRSIAELDERVSRESGNPRRRRILLDHTVVQLLYREAIENTAHSIAHLTGTPPAKPDLDPVSIEAAVRRRGGWT